MPHGFEKHRQSEADKVREAAQQRKAPAACQIPAYRLQSRRLSCSQNFKQL